MRPMRASTTCGICVVFPAEEQLGQADQQELANAQIIAQLRSELQQSSALTRVFRLRVVGCQNTKAFRVVGIKVIRF